MAKQASITVTDAVALTGLAVATRTAAYLIASEVKPEPEPTSTPVKTILTTNQQ